MSGVNLACCCTAGGSPCSLCTGQAPLQFNASFSGISLLSGCCNWNGGSARFLTSANPNVAYTLTQDDGGIWGPCTWIYRVEVSAFRYQTDLAQDCEPPFSSDNRVLQVRLTMLPGNEIELEYTAGGLLFYRRMGRNAPCRQTFNFTNLYQPPLCDPTEIQRPLPGAGGTAVVTPV